MREGEALSRVADLCAGFATVSLHHCHDGRRCKGPGLPDLIIAGPNGLLWREFKTRNDHVRPEQIAWLWTLKASGQDADIWTEAELMNGTAAREIAAVS